LLSLFKVINGGGEWLADAKALGKGSAHGVAAVCGLLE